MNKALLALLFIAFGISGCSGLRVVDSDVRSFSTPPLASANAVYRFERLPSQQANAIAQNQLEALAEAALNKKGLTHNEALATYAVMVNAALRVNPNGPNPSNGWWSHVNVGVGVQMGHVSVAGNAPFWGRPWYDGPYYWRELSLTVRELKSNKVVFETHAVNDGRFADSAAVLPAMLEAALVDYPQGAAGTKRVNIELPPQK